MKFSFKHHVLNFKNPSGTSRGVMTEKHCWIIQLWNEQTPEIIGQGECSIIEGLSPDFVAIENYEQQIRNAFLQWELNNFYADFSFLNELPSIKFGFETAFLDLKNGGKGIVFNNDFTKGMRKLPINGLIWMGTPEFMLQQIDEKLKAGFTTLKMKVGAIDFEAEYAILKEIRSNYSKEEITLRVDANGAFKPNEVLTYLKRLAALDIHSIEQPIKAGQIQEMAELCKLTPLAIALDEELIGVNSFEQKNELLEKIKPQYIILKPSLHGGISGTQEWIEIAEKYAIPWWITSALESNIGLKAICQLTAEYQNELPQGLGTGSLYHNNFETDLKVANGLIFTNPNF
jgi:o-succinylbenzoate synthase